MGGAYTVERPEAVYSDVLDERGADEQQCIREAVRGERRKDGAGSGAG